MDRGKVLYALLVLIFAAAVIGTFYVIAKKIGNNDNKNEVRDSMLTVGGLNAGLTFVLLLISFMFTRSSPDLRSGYMFMMLHLNFLLAIMAVSISAIVQYS